MAKLLDIFKRKPAVGYAQLQATPMSYGFSHTVFDQEPTPAPEAYAPDGTGYAGSYYNVNDGEKYDGGLGPVPILVTDYWALRERSSSFFKTNLYARGIIRRFVSNVINTGLSLEADPITNLLSQEDDALSDWAMDVEDKFNAWSSLADVCHFGKQHTFGEIERYAYREALVEGDVLIIEHFNPETNLPSYELVKGSLVQTPLSTIGGVEEVAEGNTVEYGIELDKKRQPVAYWVVQENFSYKRVPARGSRGRLVSWLYFATDKRHDDLRGEPMISLVMQSVSEIDKYRDSTQRKATLNAMLAMFFYQSPDSKVPNSRPVSAGANRRVVGSTQLADGSDYKVNMASSTPGIVYESLPPGMEPKGFTSDGTDEKFGEFENALVNGMAWALGIPKSVLTMSFSNSYSASRGEIKEFNMTLGVERNRFADTFTRPIYRSWLVAMVLTSRVEAPGFLAAYRDPMKFDEYAAWSNSNWFGAVKEAVDLPKEVNGLKLMADNGYSTNSMNSRQLTNTRFATNIKRVQRENALIADSIRPTLELEKEFGADAVATATARLRVVAANGSMIDE